MKPYVRIVDDEEDVRTSIALLVRLCGLEARTYESAEALLTEGEFETPGCLVLDIRMPGLNGLALQDELVKRRIDLPILFLTGHGDVQTAVLAMQRGAVDFQLKPPQPEALQASIKKYVAWHERVRAHQLRVAEARAKYSTLTFSKASRTGFSTSRSLSSAKSASKPSRATGPTLSRSSGSARPLKHATF